MRNRESIATMIAGSIGQCGVDVDMEILETVRFGTNRYEGLDL